MADSLQFAWRTQKAIGITDAAPLYAPLSGFAKAEGANLRCSAYSPCGRFFAYSANDRVDIVDASQGHVLTTLNLPLVYELAFSPRGSFLSTWERAGKDENGDATKNFKVWRTIEELPEGSQKQPVGRFVQKSQSGWNLQYTSDEQFCARMVTNEVQFYDSNDLTTVANKLRVEGITNFAIAPGSQHNVAVFIPERKGQPAAVKIFAVPQFTNPISQKTFFKGEKVQFKWNSSGTSLIVLAQTDVDKTNKSYYGDSTMYLLSVNGAFDARIQLDKEGPIHDVTWSPNGKEFGVIYGYMPSKTTIFNQRAVALHTFELKPRNTIYFSPNSRFVLVAGFGNLAGSIDIYDQEKDYRKICTIESGTPSVCDFSPDSRYILLATTSPRLRVDNGVKIWHVGGTMIYDEDFEELYNVQWRPIFPENIQPGDPLDAVPTAHASALAYLGRQKTPSKPVGAYRPPGARGMAAPLHFRREDEGGAAHVMSNGSSGLGGGNLFGRPRRAVPGAEFADPAARGVPGAAPAEVPGANGDESLSKTALKNKKKRNNKKKEGGEGQNNAGGLAPPAGEQGPGSGNEGRSRDRRHGQHPQQGQGYHNSRSRSRNPHNSRSRANTYRNGDGQPRGGHNQNHQNATPAPVIVAPAAPAIIESPLSPGSQNPGAKKVRSLQKKIRAIEDLEMRLAGGEKLEDTQIKKIATKQSVARELETLEREGH